MGISRGREFTGNISVYRDGIFYYRAYNNPVLLGMCSR